MANAFTLSNFIDHFPLSAIPYESSKLLFQLLSLVIQYITPVYQLKFTYFLLQSIFQRFSIQLYSLNQNIRQALFDQL